MIDRIEGWNDAHRQHVQWLQSQLKKAEIQLIDAEKHLAYLQGSVEAKKNILNYLLSN